MRAKCRSSLPSSKALKERGSPATNGKTNASAPRSPSKRIGSEPDSKTHLKIPWKCQGARQGNDEAGGRVPRLPRAHRQARLSPALAGASPPARHCRVPRYPPSCQQPLPWRGSSHLGVPVPCGHLQAAAARSLRGPDPPEPPQPRRLFPGTSMSFCSVDAPRLPLALYVTLLQSKPPTPARAHFTFCAPPTGSPTKDASTLDVPAVRTRTNPANLEGRPKDGLDPVEGNLSTRGQI